MSFTSYDERLMSNSYAVCNWDFGHLLLRAVIEWVDVCTCVPSHLFQHVLCHFEIKWQFPFQWSHLKNESSIKFELFARCKFHDFICQQFLHNFGCCLFTFDLNGDSVQWLPLNQTHIVEKTIINFTDQIRVVIATIVEQ